MPLKFNPEKMTGIITCFFLSGLILFNPNPTWGQEKPVGRIIGIIGTVELLIGEPVAQAKKGEVRQASAEVWEKVNKKQSVFTKDTYRTGRKSRLKILFEDKSLMALGPKTRMSVESYLYKPEDKLRQGVINMAHGLSMYIVNKSQKNKKSSFRIVSPTGNLAARGTQGYISASPDKTLIANQAGTVSVSNSDPNVGMERKSNWFEFEEGFEPLFTTAAFDENTDLFAQAPGGGEVAVGAMQKTSILQGQPPSPPVPLTPGELQAIRNVVLAKVGGSSQNKGLIE
ncbi:MAG: FecR domain-containing protein, partial [Nitrospina sp.]|nr:FecR domain-containing protein [Nitrospina sp.]